MKSMKKWLGYISFGVVVLLFSIYHLFPSELIVNYIQNGLQQMNSGYQVSIQKASLKFPMGVKFQDVDLYHNDLLVFEANDVFMKPRYKTIFMKKKMIWFEIGAYDGILTGLMEMGRIDKNTRPNIDASFHDLKIRDISAFNRMANLDISGFLSGKMSINLEDGSQNRIDANIHIKDGLVQLPIPLLNLGNLSFKSIDADIQVVDNQMELNDCVFKGNEVDVILGGTGIIHEIFDKTRLDLAGTIELTPLMENKDGRVNYSGVLTRMKKYKNGIPVKIGGTIRNPEFSLKL